MSIRKLLPEPKFTPEPEPGFRLKVETPAKTQPKPKPKIRTVPPIDECSSISKIRNLKVYLESAVIEYLTDVDSSAVEAIENKISCVKPCVFMTDLKGKGLNRRARVTMYDFWPVYNGNILKNTSEYPLRGILDRFLYDLRSQNGFVDYNLDTGQFVYETDFFESE